MDGGIYLLKRFLSRAWMGLTFKRKHLTSCMQKCWRKGRLWRREPLIWQTPLPSDPNFPWLEGWSAAHHALPLKSLKMPSHRNGLHFPRGKAQVSGYGGGRVTSLKQLWSGHPAMPRPLSSPSTAPEYSRNWAGGGNHHSSSCLFRAQWAHIDT